MGRAESFLKRQTQAGGGAMQSLQKAAAVLPIQSPSGRSVGAEPDPRELPAWAKGVAGVGQQSESVRPTNFGRQRTVSNGNHRLKHVRPFFPTSSFARTSSIGGLVAACLIGVGVFAWIANQNETNASSSSGSGSTRDIAELHKEVSAKVFAIEVTGGAGTGFAVTDRDLITNKHVVEDVGKRAMCKVRNPNYGGVMTGKVRQIAKTHDLAWIEMDEPLPCKPLKISNALCRVGDFVFTEGYPGYGYKIGSGYKKWDYDNLQSVYKSGEISVSNRVWDETKTRCYETTATINSGNSGGPLLNANGEVVGVNSFGLSKIQDTENVFFAIKIDVVRDELPLLWDKIHGRDISNIYEFAD